MTYPYLQDLINPHYYLDNPEFQIRNNIHIIIYQRQRNISSRSQILQRENILMKYNQNI